jgi:hypothetical protein
MSNIVAEQMDMIAVTEALESDDVSPLLPVLDNLRRCMLDVAPLLDIVAARVDAGSPLAFAVADLEDAAASLKGGDKLDALDAQEVAAESLEEVNVLVEAVNLRPDMFPRLLNSYMSPSRIPQRWNTNKMSWLARWSQPSRRN